MDFILEEPLAIGPKNEGELDYDHPPCPELCCLYWNPGIDWDHIFGPNNNG